jgi:hypothetical protein
MGVDTEKKLMTADLRPVQITYEASIIKEILV